MLGKVRNIRFAASGGARLCDDQRAMDGGRRRHWKFKMDQQRKRCLALTDFVAATSDRGGPRRHLY